MFLPFPPVLALLPRGAAGTFRDSVEGNKSVGGIARPVFEGHAKEQGR
jgi:hypothetical protein